MIENKYLLYLKIFSTVLYVKYFAFLPWCLIIRCFLKSFVHINYVICHILRSLAEIGDFLPEKYTDSSYLSSHKFMPHQEGELERKIMENHKKLM